MPDEPDIALHMPTLEVEASSASFIIELGCGDGHGSLRALARGFRKSPFRELYVSVDQRTDRPQFDDRPTEPWWHLVHGDTADTDTAGQVAYIAAGSLADLVFIDTNHTYEHMSRELEVWNRLVSRSAVWLFHDTWMSGTYNRMTDAVKEFAWREGRQYSDLSYSSHGLGMMC